MKELHDFVDQLLAFQTPDHGSDAKRTFLAEHSNALFVVAMTLHNVGVIGGGEEHPDPPNSCDLCSKAFGDDAFFVDGQTGRMQSVQYTDPATGLMASAAHGSWADMCVDCYGREGRGIGWGIGQLYRKVLDDSGSPRWLLIAGGDPFGQRGATEG